MKTSLDSGPTSFEVPDSSYGTNRSWAHGPLMGESLSNAPMVLVTWSTQKKNYTALVCNFVQVHEQYTCVSFVNESLYYNSQKSSLYKVLSVSKICMYQFCEWIIIIYFVQIQPTTKCHCEVSCWHFSHTGTIFFVCISLNPSKFTRTFSKHFTHGICVKGIILKAAVFCWSPIS